MPGPGPMPGPRPRMMNEVNELEINN
jgi:hypothetical protein